MRFDPDRHQPQRSDALAEALALEARGLGLVPVEPGGKEPYFDLLPRVKGRPEIQALKEERATRATIEGWFSNGRLPNIGVVTGEVSGGLAVVDLDQKTPVFHHPPTPCVRTPGRGWHVWTRRSDPVPRAIRAWGEVRAEGDYAVAPPSTGANGKPYEWAISLGECGLADYDDVVFLPAAQMPSQEGNQERAYDLARFPSQKFEVESIARDPKHLPEVLRVMGIQAQPEKAFRCVLPGHKEKNPSAAIFWDKRTESFRYHDFHGPLRGDPEFLSLAEVYAAQHYREIRDLSPVESISWYLRLAYDAGLIKPPIPELPPLPRSAPQAARKLTAGFQLHLALRTFRFGPAPVPFAWTFAGAWSGIAGNRHVGQAIAYLLDHKVIEKAGRQRRTMLYVAGTGR